MTITLLCSGPSLLKFPGRNAGDFVIGVNRVATQFECDAWACCDWQLLERIRGEVVGSPVLFTTASSANYLRDHSPAHDAPRPWREILTIESLYEFCPRELQWDSFSSTAALVYAAHHASGKPAAIECYGVDWIGKLDWDGDEGGDRSERRWRGEAAIWQNRMIPWLAERQIEVNRHEN